ncbi:MAG: alpha/beta fold hydrolase [Actinomycetota bacterium]
MREMAQALATNAYSVLTLDYPGFGDSSGEPGSLAAMIAVAAAGAQLLRSQGCSDVALGGIRWGAALALHCADSVGASAVVAFAPVTSAKRYVRELRLLGLPDPNGSGGMSVGGYYLSGALLEEIARLPLAMPATCPVLVIEHGEEDRWGGQDSEGAQVNTWSAARLGEFLDRTAEDAVVDRPLFDRAAEWLSSQAPRAPQSAPAFGVPRIASSALVSSDGARCRESFVYLGRDQHPGVMSEPVDSDAAGILVLLNSGSDPHSGPGRAWVEVSRFLAASHGWAVVRVDARGWGQAADGPSGPGRPYDPHFEVDIAQMVGTLREMGWARIVLSGLCSGAWMALEVARRGGVDGAIALNPQMYWQYGDVVEALMADVVARRADETADIRAKAARGVWDREDAAGERCPAARWLDDLAAQEIPVELMFVTDDPGHQYLQERLAARVAAVTSRGDVQIATLPGVDHAMHQVWLRREALDAFATALMRM